MTLKQAVAGFDGSAPSGSSSRHKIPDPKEFAGARNAKELENFVWDMELYFDAAKIPLDEQVSITNMYLTGDAKLWWRTRICEDEDGRWPKIKTWENLKQVLKQQFLSQNALRLARNALKVLKHTSSI